MTPDQVGTAAGVWVDVWRNLPLIFIILYLALAMTESEEKHERHQLMIQEGITELEAALRVAERMDRSRGIEPLTAEVLLASITTNIAT